MVFVYYVSTKALGLLGPSNFETRGLDMNKELGITAFLIILAVSLNLGMARKPDQYDQDARAQEKADKQMEKDVQAQEQSHPAKNFATGIKEVTYDNVRDTLSDTGSSTMHEKPVVGTLDGTQQAGEKVVDNTIKGIKKVASLGYAKNDHYEIDQPEKGSGDAAKIKLFRF